MTTKKLAPYEHFHEALYMQDAFYIQFMDDNDCLITFHEEAHGHFCMYNRKIDGMVDIEKTNFHIAPESYHIYEPKEGDLIAYSQPNDDHLSFFFKGKQTFHHCIRQIIQRDNKAFLDRGWV